MQPAAYEELKLDADDLLVFVRRDRLSHKLHYETPRPRLLSAADPQAFIASAVSRPLCANTGRSPTMRIPMKPATHSKRKPATDSDLKPAGVPI
jgi:hypothetical protein